MADTKARKKLQTLVFARVESDRHFLPRGWKQGDKEREQGTYILKICKERYVTLNV